MKIAAVLPAYNAETYIGAALDSVYDQSRQVDEIVVADDASSDCTQAAVAAWMNRSRQPVKIIRLEQNGGAGAARNAGFQETDADIVAMLDADDTWRPEMIECLVGALETHPEAIVAFGLREYFDDNGPSGEYQGEARLGGIVGDAKSGGVYELDCETAYRLNLQSAVTSCSAAVVRRDAAIECGMFDPGFRTSQDRDFFLRLSRQGSFLFVNAPVSLYRLHTNNTTHGRNAVRNAFNGTRVIDKMLLHSDSLRLSAHEYRMTREALNKSAITTLYAASQRGLSALLKAKRDVATTAAHVRLPDISNLLIRACWRSILPDKDLKS